MDKNLDCKGRWRNKTVAFRVSEEEAKLIDTQVALSGLTKQDYIIRRLWWYRAIREYIRHYAIRWQIFMRS